jgi:hypothetical protein
MNLLHKLLFADLRFVSIAKQTNRRKRPVFKETHLQKIFFEN